MRGQTDFIEDQKLANNYETAYSHNKARHSSNYESPRSFNSSQEEKPNNMMRRSTQYDSQISKQYAMIRSRNDTGYSTELQQTNKNMNNPRSYRLFVTYMENQQHQGDFIVYFVANKQSNSGVFSHQRLFVIDSYEKTFKYFSKIPDLPIKSLSEIKQAKDVIYLLKANRFFYTPRQNTIGQVTISWMDEEGKREWSLNMGTKKMVKQVGVILNQIKQNKKVSFREIKQKIREIEDKSISKSKEKDTVFISQIKTLQAKQKKDSHRTIIFEAPSTRSSRFPQKKSEALRKKSVSKNQQKDKANGSDSPQQTPINRIDEASHQLKIEELIAAAELQTKKIRKQNQKSNKELKEADSEQQKKADVREQQQKPNIISEFQNTETIQVKQASELEKMIANRKTQLAVEASNEKDTVNNSINDSRMLYESIQQKVTLKQVSKQTPKIILKNQLKQNSKYQENERLYRMALLEERRKLHPHLNKITTKLLNNQVRSRSQSNRKSDASSRFSKYESQWIVRWLLAKNKTQLAQVYCKFTDSCLAKVQSWTEKYSEWHLSHNPSNQSYKFQSQGIQFTYFMHLQKSNNNTSLQQQILVFNFNNNSYLLSCVKFKQNNEVQIGIPLSCIVEWMGLKVFCEATLTGQRLQIASHSDIKIQYGNQLANFQKLSKVSLQNASILQIKLNNRLFLYFQKATIMPKLPKINQQLHNEYLSKYIEKGVVRNETDLERIAQHIGQSLIKQTLQKLECLSIISSLQFKNRLTKLGLSQNWIQHLLEQSIKQQYVKSTALCFSHLISLKLVEHIREEIHKHLMKRTHRKSVIDVVYRQLAYWFEQKPQIVQIINTKLKECKLSNNLTLQSQFSQQYILTSVLLQLGLKIEIKTRPDLQNIRAKNTCFWKEIVFDRKNIVLNFIPKIQNYRYEAFQQNFHVMNDNLFAAEKVVISENFNKEILLKLINKKEQMQYWQSELYRLMNTFQKICVNEYFAYYLPYDSKQTSNFSKIEWMYDSLKTNPTTFIVTQKHFNISLLGIKWLIKSQNHLQAKIRLNQQLWRLLIWCKHVPQLLIDTYDLKFQHAQLTHDYEQMLTNGLMSFQTTIKYFAQSQEKDCSMIISKCLRVAGTHYKLSKYQKSLYLYNTAENLLQKMENEDIKNIEDNQLIYIFNRQTKILMALCRMQQAIENCYLSLKKYERYLIIFKGSQEYLNKIEVQQFSTYLLLLRCHQISLNYSAIFQLVRQISPQLIQKVILNVQKVTQLSLPENNRIKFIELTKYLWLAVIHTAASHTLQKIDGQRSINVERITNFVGLLSKQSRGLYRYRIEQVYKYIASIISASSRSDQPEFSNHSIFMYVVLQNFQKLSQLQIHTKRCKIYDQNNKEDPLLFLQCLLHTVGYNFALGTLLQLRNQPIF